MEKNQNTIVTKKADYSVAIDKAEGTVLVTYGKDLVAKSKRGWLIWFIVCIVMAALAFIDVTTALVNEDISAVEYVLFVIVFAALGGVSWTQFANFRQWLRGFKQ